METADGKTMTGANETMYFDTDGMEQEQFHEEGVSFTFTPIKYLNVCS